MSTFIISCGGTGGHLAPGIALAEGLMERGHRCYLLISNKEVDARLIAKYGHLEFVRVPGVGLGGGLKGFFRFSIEQLRGIVFGMRLLKRLKPDMIVGFGGFTTVGIVLAGYFLGCPIVLHEANHRVGKAIRLLSGLAKRVYLPSGVGLKNLSAKVVRHFGYPVRREIRPLERGEACEKLGLRAGVKRILVFGGSQGASVLNRWVVDNFERLGALGIHIYCVTGMGKCERERLKYVREDGELVDAYAHVVCLVKLTCWLLI